MGMKERLAETRKQQEIAKKVFSNSVLKDADGKPVQSVSLGGKYFLHSKDSDKKIGWVKLPSRPGEASVGWVNLPDYMKMEEPVNVPEEFKGETWDTVDLAEYDVENIEPEIEDRTKDVAHYIVKIHHLLEDYIKSDPTKRAEVEKNMMQMDEMYAMECDYDGLDGVVDLATEYAMLDNIQCRQSESMPSNAPTTYMEQQSYLSGQISKAKADIRTKFEEAYPDLDFETIMTKTIHARYHNRYLEEVNKTMGRPVFEMDTEMEKAIYAADYNMFIDDYERSKKRDVARDGGKMSASDWKANRQKMYREQLICDFIERDFRKQYSEDVCQVVKNYGFATGPVRNRQGVDEKIEAKFGDKGVETSSGVEF